MDLILTQLLTQLLTQFDATRHRLRRQPAARRRADDGYSVEMVVVTALLVALSIGMVGAIAAKVLAKARGLDLDG